MKTIALIVAGGFSSRFNSKIPKQYTSSILSQTIKKFLSAKIDQIQVVIRPEDLDLYNQQTIGLDLLPPCFGGPTRGNSVQNGLEAIAKYQPDLVLVHDACRPFISVNMINQIIEQLKSNPQHAVIPCIKIVETLKRITEDHLELIDRENLFLIQTPQGFNFNMLLNAYRNNTNFYTDESSLIESQNLPIIYIPGERENIKITYQDDTRIKMDIRSGIGFDAHRYADETSENNHIILGGIKISFEKKLEAHSDGDVLIHALVDALLGSIGAGDIGMHFPPSDMKWKNADSKIFLIHTNDLLKQKNAIINNIDLTVICEAPRLGAYREQIKTNLAKILDINEEKVNIKATTTEKMGFTGRGEGIAVQAICSVSIRPL